MRLGKVIGKVTLSRQVESFTGGRWLVVRPLSREALAGAAAPAEPSLVCYDRLGAANGNIVGYVEGREAAQPFEDDVPVDAYAALIVDTINYMPPKKP
ncbi:MAG: ethanolamine utilization protein EutN [Verrucomicrobiae bacterium]|nr:ethanolamine utilization protein EutN [Verrucomicrobiae bacterium]